jgi:hypothetical protein
MRGIGVRSIGVLNPVMMVKCPDGAAVVVPVIWDNGDMDAWVTDQIWVESLAPKTGSTGDMDAWITDQLWIQAFGDSGV